MGVTLRRWPRKVSNCTTRPHVRGDQARRNQRGKQNRNLCSAAALKPENFICQQEKAGALCVSANCNCSYFCFQKEVKYFRQLNLGQKTSKVFTPTLFFHFSGL